MSGQAVLLLEPLHPDARAALDAGAAVFELDAPDGDLAGVPLEQVSGLITRGRGQVNAALLARLPALRVVARAGVGLDNVDLEAAAARGIAVLNVPDALTTTVAEHAVALALAARRDVPASAAAARAGRWAERAHYAGASVAGSRVVIVGTGAIGTRAAALFRAFGAEVVLWNRSSPKGPRLGSQPGPEFEPVLDRALDGADIVSLHTALTTDTRGILDGARLERVARGATIVNTARPALVDRAAMLEALGTGRVGAYAVDGFDPEPPAVDDPLLAHPRVIVTPHVAALTRETFRELCVATVAGTLDVLEGRDLAGLARLV